MDQNQDYLKYHLNQNPQIGLIQDLHYPDKIYYRNFHEFFDVIFFLFLLFSAIPIFVILQDFLSNQYIHYFDDKLAKS